MLPAVLALVGVSFVIALALTAAARAVALKRQLLDTPGSAGHVKRDIRRVPNIGGVGIFWAVALPMLIGLALAWWESGDLLTRLAPAAAAHLPGMRAQTPLAVALLGALLVLHITGLIDDRRALGAWPKMLIMAATAGVLVIGFDVRLLELLDARAGGAWLSITLTILWFLAVTNAMNFMDNMDGLSGSVGVTAGALFLAAALINAQWFVAAVLALLVGALLGFLCFNFPWRKNGALIFMGDGGSLVLGFLLAFLTVRTTYYAEPSATSSTTGLGNAYAVFMPLCVLAVPIYDMLSVTVLRLAQGKSPMVGDQQHFSHRLRDKGLSVRQALAVINGCTAATGITGILLGSLSGWQAILAGAQVILVIIVLGIYEHASWARHRI
jgi:UDP-GlcNAc:undecaprenyl-phosphate/decaprenyl-phosphate GlcNAc-1-phosphate transferase